MSWATSSARPAGTILFDTQVDAIREAPDFVTVAAKDRSWQARKLVACTGLQSDRVARLAGLAIDHQVIPFRGEYYDIAAPKRDLVRHLIYPVPDPALPFLGIHLTPTIDGGPDGRAECGARLRARGLRKTVVRHPGRRDLRAVPRLLARHGAELAIGPGGGGETR